MTDDSDLAVHPGQLVRTETSQGAASYSLANNSNHLDRCLSNYYLSVTRETGKVYPSLSPVPPTDTLQTLNQIKGCTLKSEAKLDDLHLLLIPLTSSLFSQVNVSLCRQNYLIKINKTWISIGYRVTLVDAAGENFFQIFSLPT